MLSILDANPSTYTAWAEDYYERSVSLSAVQQIYGHVVIESLLADAAEIDYPATRI